MKGKNKKKPQKSPDSKTYTMQYNPQAIDPYKDMPIEELEKALDLASARLVYANDMVAQWRQKEHNRGRTFNAVLVAYRQKKHGFTDEQIQGEPNTSSASWAYAK
jgi:hypothetical protein